LRSSDPKGASPLVLRLPAELRNIVYDYVFGNSIYPLAGSHERLTKDALALLYVNRQLYTETALLPYCTGTFASEALNILREFIDRRTPAQLQAINSIQLRTLNCQPLSTIEWIFTRQAFSCLKRMPGLSRVEIVDRTRVLIHEQNIKAIMSTYVRWVHFWVPNVVCVARDCEGLWQLEEG